MNTSGNRLKLLRVEAGLDQHELANLAGLRQPQISMIETGDRQMTLVQARRLAGPLKTTAAYLLILTDVQSPEVACVPA